MKALTDAFNLFTQTTATMEESYQRLEAQIQALDKELEDKNRELALTTDHLNSILDSMSDGVIAVDTEGRITTYNRAAAEALGFEQRDVIGKRHADVFGSQGLPTRTNRVTELHAKDGRLIPVNEKRSAISDRADTRVGTLYVFQDLREIEALREEVRQKDRLAAVGQMAATVAHEIRNPLGGIRGFAELLARDISEDDARSRLVQKILIGTKSLDGVVNELLEYTRPPELNFEETNCRALVDAAIAYLDLEGGEVEVLNEVHPETHVRADAQKMRQVFLNVLLNAVQSINGPGRVTVTCTVDATAATLYFIDTGCGIPPQDVDNVFSPFFTTKEKGTGLGLAVAAKTVESHGGAIDVVSDVDAGSKIRIRLLRPEN